MLFMATIFGNGDIENLPVGVADCSNSTLSHKIIRAANASPTLDIQQRHIFSNEAQAKEALQNMEIYGYLSIPQNFDRDLYNGNTPTITYYYNYALLAAGGEIQGAFAKSLAEISISLADESGKTAGIPQYKTDAIALPAQGLFVSTYNPSLNYSTFLSYPFFFVFFQIFILVFTVYIIGTDLNKEWLQAAGGNIWKALVGKLAPYASIFLVESLLANWVFFTIAGIPLQGSLLTINIASILLTVSTMALGTAIISLIPKVSIAISIASMTGALGATASGITFPLENMYPIFHKFCSLFPIRHFVLAVQSALYNGSGLSNSWESLAAMVAVTAITLAAAPLLKHAALSGSSKPLPIMWGVSLIILGGSIGYGFLYGLLYHPNIVTEVPVATVDNSNSKTSRRFIQELDATQGIDITAVCGDIHLAGQLMKEGKIKGIIYIPDNFTEQIIRGNQAYFAVWHSTCSFLYSLTIQQAASTTMQHLCNTLRTGTVETLPLEQKLIAAQTPAFNTRGVAIYNHTGGYGTYLLPIAVIIIIFQTMLMSGGILAGSHSIHPLKYIPALAVAYFLLSFFLTGLIPAIFNLPALAAPAELYIFLFLFILASAAFTGAVTMFLKDTEEVMLYVPFFSIGLIFLSGTSFPITQIPHLWQIVHYLFPTSAGITGYIQLNSMGGSLHNITGPITLLAAQCVIYGTIFLLYTRKIVHLHK